MLSGGLQGWVRGSDIRQHARLQGHPQQWNWRRLIDRLLEAKPVQIASHFHAPTLLALHQGEGGRLRETRVCVWEVGAPLKESAGFKPTRELDVTLTVICTQRTHIDIKWELCAWGVVFLVRGCISSHRLENNIRDWQVVQPCTLCPCACFNKPEKSKTRFPAEIKLKHCTRYVVVVVTHLPVLCCRSKPYRYNPDTTHSHVQSLDDLNAQLLRSPVPENIY